jgi:hypothetical protein
MLDEEPHSLYSSPSINVIKSSRMRLMRYAYKILVKKPEVKPLLQRPRHSWEDNVRMNFKEKGWNVVNWIRPVQGRGLECVLINTLMNLRVP